MDFFMLEAAAQTENWIWSFGNVSTMVRCSEMSSSFSFFSVVHWEANVAVGLYQLDIANHIVEHVSLPCISFCQSSFLCICSLVITQCVVRSDCVYTKYDEHRIGTYLFCCCLAGGDFNHLLKIYTSFEWMNEEKNRSYQMTITNKTIALCLLKKTSALGTLLSTYRLLFT